VPSLFNLDLLRASLGPQLASPYEAAFGAVPWLTAGTFAWPAEDSERVLSAWLRWSDPPLSAIRLGASEVAIDVAVHGDPWGVPARIEALRALAPGLDTVAPADLRMLRSPALVAAAELALPAAPPAAALLAAARAVPEGVCLGVRRAAPTGLSLVGVGAAAELPRTLAALDQAARALGDEVEVA
jgi:hypothetical protein